MKVQIFLALLLALAVAEKTYYTHESPASSNGEPSSIEQSDFPKADLSSLSGSSGSSSQTIYRTDKALKNGDHEANRNPGPSIDALFLRHPSLTELDDLILGADSVALLRTIQNLATDDSLPCSTVVDYLLEMLGRIRTAIEQKQFLANQLKVIIDGALAEIARLEGQIDRLEGDKKALWLDELRDRLSKLVRELEACYQNFNAVESQIAPNEARVAGFEKEIAILNKESDAERNRIANDKLRLTEVDALISDLENQLRNARNRREALIASIAKSEAIIKENDRKIADARDKIAALEKEIAALRDKADQIRRKCTDLEIQVERLRTDIAVAEAKEDRINDQIDDLTRRINLEKQKLVSDDLDDLNAMIARLRALIPGIEREIDRQYYYCYGDGAIKIEETGGVVVYIVRGESFGNYLLNVYGQSVRAGSLTNAEYNFYRVDIFSPIWTGKFGFPPVVSNGGNNFDGEFSCASSVAQVSGQGVITGISANGFRIAHSDGHEMHLNAGACSRIESATQLPRIGQNLAFKAMPSSAGGYNIIGATCW